MLRTGPDTRYARSGDARIAYQVAGDGPLDLLVVPGLISHLELQWQRPSYRQFVRALAGAARLILFDKRGTGARGIQDGESQLVALPDEVLGDAAVRAEIRALLAARPELAERAAGPTREDIAAGVPR